MRKRLIALLADPKRVMRKIPILLLRPTHLLPTSIPLESMRCHDSPFSRLQGFGGKSIDHFPPCEFFQISLNDPQLAFDRFCEWLRHCLLEMEAWKIPKSQGGWANGSLVKLALEAHRQLGIQLDEFGDADPTITWKAIETRAKYYLDLFDFIKGGNSLPPIPCRKVGPWHVIANGHHRASSFWVLGHTRVKVKIVQ